MTALMAHLQLSNTGVIIITIYGRQDIRAVHGLGATESPVAIQPTLLFPIPFNVWDPCEAFGTP